MPSTNDSTRGLVLVIDEDMSVLSSFSRHLEKCGYEVMTARDGLTATQLIAVHPPDLIVSDLHIPAMEGVPFFRHIEKRWPEIPIIITSSTMEVAEVVASIRKGASDFLVKPLKEMTTLSQAVTGAIRASRLKQQNHVYREYMAKTFPESAKELKAANRHLTEQNRRLKEVVLSSQRLASCDTVESFGACLLQEFSHQLDASGGSLYLAGQEGLRLVHSLDRGHAPPFISYPVKKSSPFGFALRRKEPILIGDIHHTRALRPSGYDGYHSGSFMVFPLQTPEGKPFGLVSLHEKKRPPFIKQDREVGALLASWSAETLRSRRNLETLTQKKEKYRLAALTASDIISEWDPATDDLVWFGNIDTVIGSTPENRPTTMAAWLSLIHPDDRQRISETYRNHLTVATAPPMDYRVRHLAHGWRLFRERIATTKAGIGDVKVLRACNDLTQAKDAEEERVKFELTMQHAQKLKNMEIIAGGFAHDANDLIMSVLGHADIALEETGENPAARKSLRNIVSAGNCATELAKQLIVYSGKGEEGTRTVNINDIVSDMMRLIDVSLSKKVRLIFHPGLAPLTVKGRQSQLRQVVLNLLTNASRAIGPHRGQIMLHTGKTFCSMEDLAACSMPVRTGVDTPLPEGTYAFIDIEDTGCGMDETTRKKLCEPPQATQNTGIGLGMAAVLCIVREHRGTLTISSTPEVGTRIRVLLPSSPAPNAAE